MYKFRASIAGQALAGAFSVALFATPAAAVTLTGECVSCMAAPFASSAGAMGFQKDIGPPNCIKGCGAVPEPMSWVLMIFGFGLAGANLRARRRLGGA